MNITSLRSQLPETDPTMPSCCTQIKVDALW